MTAALACQRPHEPPPPLPDPQDIPANVDRIATKVLDDTGVPSAVVAAVAGGKVVYAHAYGNARLEPKTPATLQMRYSIGSISKQLTATAVLLLAEDGVLSLDDHVANYLPGLTRSDEITLRQLLSHTSGYPDYWPQDYLILDVQTPTTSQAILDRWAKGPLEFEPGTRYQYSNTNFVIAGVICEQVSGMPLFEFLTDRVFRKLGMTSVANIARDQLTQADAQGYFQRALGPRHPAPPEAPGWTAAAAELAMTAEDLAKWDLSMIEQSILTPASYHQLETEVVLASGAGTRYALGVGVGLTQGHRELRHSGEVSGFVASNLVLPDDKLAVVVLTNQDASSAADQISGRVRDVLLRIAGASQDSDRVVRQILDDLAGHRLDRSKLTANASAYFTGEALDEFAASLAPLGPPERFEPGAVTRRGAMIGRWYKVTYASRSLQISVYETPDGKIEQFLIEEAG
ncbi:MAG TPA: serine hydrolase domain-containing protein [Kofleriaceae bacterium]|nr:serine hydrolase domain-containing protein [Kofleriaceae bacterium]